MELPKDALLGAACGLIVSAVAFVLISPLSAADHSASAPTAPVASETGAPSVDATATPASSAAPAASTAPSSTPQPTPETSLVQRGEANYIALTPFQQQQVDLGTKNLARLLPNGTKLLYRGATDQREWSPGGYGGERYLYSWVYSIPEAPQDAESSTRYRAEKAGLEVPTPLDQSRCVSSNFQEERGLVGYDMVDEPGFRCEMTVSAKKTSKLTGERWWARMIIVGVPLKYAADRKQPDVLDQTFAPTKDQSVLMVSAWIPEVSKVSQQEDGQQDVNHVMGTVKVNQNDYKWAQSIGPKQKKVVLRVGKPALCWSRDNGCYADAIAPLPGLYYVSGTETSAPLLGFVAEDTFQPIKFLKQVGSTSVPRFSVAAKRGSMKNVVRVDDVRKIQGKELAAGTVLLCSDTLTCQQLWNLKFSGPLNSVLWLRKDIHMSNPDGLIVTHKGAFE